MQQAPSQVSSGPIAPTIVGPGKDRDVFVISGLVISLAALIGAFWFYSSADHSPAGLSDPLTGAQVSQALKTGDDPLVTPVSLPVKTDQPTDRAQPMILHRDLYFEVGRKGLTDEAKKQLQEQAAVLTQDGNLGVLVQGYTDQQGSAGYNKALGMKRAEAVKAELLKAGVAEHQVKVMSLGKEGVLCIDDSDICRQMNRRVHLEIRTIGQEHMIPPVIATTPAVEPPQAADDQSQHGGDHGSFLDGIIPPANASEGKEPVALEPASGS